MGLVQSLARWLYILSFVIYFKLFDRICHDVMFKLGTPAVRVNNSIVIACECEIKAGQI